MRRAIAFWGALILGLGIGVPAASAAVVAPPAGAVVVGTVSGNCPSPAFATINAAIAAPTVPAGSTIYVCAGTYSEAVSVTKDVTLLGAQFGVSATTGRTDSSQETIIDSPAGADVTYAGVSTGTLSGFSLIGNDKDAGNDDGIDAFQSSGQSGFTWTDNIITGTSTGINFRADGPGPTTISANRITANTEAGGTEGSNGIFFTNGPANDVTISGNVFGGQGQDLNTTGMGIAAGPLSQNLVVTDNTSVNSANFVVLFLTSDAVVSDNTVAWTNPNDPSAGSAIFVSGGNVGPRIEANTISGGAATGINLNADFYTPSSAVTVSNNTIVDRLNGIRVAQDAGLTTTSSINGNTVTGAGVGDGGGSGGNGIWLQSGTGVVVNGNAASGSVSTDCRDETTGTGTAGTANAWMLDTGITSSPPGLCVAPAISVVKTADPSIVQRAGQSVTYSFLVTNNGNGPLSGISVADTFTAPSTGSLTAACPATTLAAGASMTCTATYAATQADLDNGVINDSATATGTPASGPPVISSPSSISVNAPPAPSITLVKTASVSSFASAGTSVTYRYMVTNTGNVTLNPVTVSDPMVGLSAISCPTKSLAPGSGEICTATYETTTADLSAGSITNTATATGAPPATAANPTPTPVTATSSTTVTAHRLVALQLHKRASVRTVLPGADVTYRLTVSNPNSVAVRRITVCDTLPTGEEFAAARPAAYPSGDRYCWTIGRLNPRATKHLELTVNVSIRHGARLVNHATARAQGLPETSHAVAAITVKPAPISSCASASRARANSPKTNHPVARVAC